MSRFHRPNFGSIGTQGYTTVASLIASFIGELRQQRPLHERHRVLLRDFDENRDFAEYAVDPATLPALIHALSTYAPKGFHFGPSPSDSTDFGYWPDEDHGRNEGLLEAEQRREAEETIAVQTAESLELNDWPTLNP